jgi:hypothetical protein
MPLSMARVFSTNRQKNFFADRDDRELTLRARLKPVTMLAAFVPARKASRIAPTQALRYE